MCRGTAHRRIRTDGDGYLEGIITDSAVCAAVGHSILGEAAVVEEQGVRLASKLESLVQVAGREFVVARLLVTLGAVEEEVDVAGLFCDGLGEVRNGRGVVFQAALRQRPQVPRLGVCRPELNSHVKVLHRMLVLSYIGIHTHTHTHIHTH